MLAPGEFLLKPPATLPASPAAVNSPTPLETPVLALAVTPPDQAVRPVPPTLPSEEPESRSFLLILLRALGAVHY
jgi:hypothetical protein